MLLLADALLVATDAGWDCGDQASYHLMLRQSDGLVAAWQEDASGITR